MQALPIISRWISRLSHPVLMFPLAIVLLFIAFDAAAQLGVVLLLSFALPFSIFLLMLKAKRVSDFDISNRKQRYPIYLASLIGMVLALAYLYATGGQIFFEYLRLLLMAIAIVVVNFKIKVSIHTALILTLSILLWTSFGVSPLILILPFVVALSRIQLKRHSWMEVVLAFLIPILFYVDRF